MQTFAVKTLQRRHIPNSTFPALAALSGIAPGSSALPALAAVGKEYGLPVAKSGILDKLSKIGDTSVFKGAINLLRENKAPAGVILGAAALAGLSLGAYKIFQAWQRYKDKDHLKKGSGIVPYGQRVANGMISELRAVVPGLFADKDWAAELHAHIMDRIANYQHDPEQMMGALSDIYAQVVKQGGRDKMDENEGGGILLDSLIDGEPSRPSGKRCGRGAVMAAH